MKRKLYNESINKLKLKDELVNIFEKNNVNTLGDLINKTKKEIKSFGVEQEVVNQMEIKLELIGLCFKNSL